MTAQPAYLQPNAVVAGKYRVEGVIGKGGMGTVVAAEHTLLKQRVALKFLLDVEGPTIIERFFREARAATRIESDHICRVMDLGTLDDGAPFIVMELLTGADLSDTARKRGPLPIALAADYVLQALDALVEAHARGIVHRDLKPSNLFIARRADGTEVLKILDFGISKLEGGGELVGVAETATASGGLLDTVDAMPQPPPPEMTQTGSMMGSPPYMSPEQLRSARDVDARTDVWALGIILYELVAGTRPFTGPSTAHLVHAIIAGNYVPLRVRRPDVPPAFERAVDSCLRTDMWTRCPSAIALAEALAPFVPDGDARIARARRIARSVPSVRDAAVPSAPMVAAGSVHLPAPSKVVTEGPVAFEPTRSKKGWLLPLGMAIVLAAAVTAVAVAVHSRTLARQAATAAAAGAREVAAAASVPAASPVAPVVSAGNAATEPADLDAAAPAAPAGSGAAASGPAAASGSASVTPPSGIPSARPTGAPPRRPRGPKRPDPSGVDLGRY